MKNEKNARVALRALCEGALMVALAQVLSYLKLWELPQGGSITIGMLPIFLFCVRWGFCRGMLASVAFSVLQLTLDGAFAYSWQSMLGDYIIAYSVLGLAGLFARKKYGFFIGCIVGSAARFFIHWIVGATVWAEYMPEAFFGMTMTSPWFYSALYNGSFIMLSLLLTLLLGVLLYKPMGTYMTCQLPPSAK